MPDQLPRGIWYEEAKQRFRVRLYRNNRPYRGGYFPTLEKALLALERLKEQLRSIPKHSRKNRPHDLPLPGDITGLCQSLLRQHGA